MLTLITIAVVVLVYFQFRGDFLNREQLTMMSARAGLSMDPGAKVTYNGVEIGRVGNVSAVSVGDQPQAKITLDVDPQVHQADPAERQRRDQRHHGVRQQVHLVHVAERSRRRNASRPSDVIDVTSVTTEFNTLFETVVDGGVSRSTRSS